MKRKTETSELIFKIIAYFVLIVFALMCVYPLLYALSSSISTAENVDGGNIILWPMGFQFSAFAYVLTNNMFWVNYANTLFVTFFGTVWALIYSILGAYALSKKRLMGRHGWNFFLVFTMWFSAGIIPQYTNYLNTYDVFSAIGITDYKWLIVIAMGMNAQNIILLRNAFEGVPSEIEEAARIDGATEMQILWQVYIPMSKATIATVALFFGISRWNGYFWAYKVTPESDSFSWPIQVYIRNFFQNYTDLTGSTSADYEENMRSWSLTKDFSTISVVYAMVVCAIIPILCIYPFIQKYFAKGVNMGGVKE
jgi:putative aldouronate transport system permease protein